MLYDLIEAIWSRIGIPGCRYALFMLIIISCRVAHAQTDQDDVLAQAVAQAFTPAQLSTLIHSATGNIGPDANHASPSLGRLQELLDVNRDVALALLRILDQHDVTPEQSARILAQSAILYHSIPDQLTEARLDDDPEIHRLVTLAEAAITAGQFGATEALRQLGDTKFASTDPSSSQITASRHLITAAHAHVVLAMIGLIELRNDEAADHFEQVHRILALLSADPDWAPSHPSDASTAMVLTEQERPQIADHRGMAGHQFMPIDTTAANPADSESASTRSLAAPSPPQLHLGVEESTRSQPALAQPAAQHDLNHEVLPQDNDAAVPVSTDVTANEANAATTTAPHDISEQRTALPTGDAGSNLAPKNLNLQADILELLRQRADHLLALGDLSSARLLYERAAGAGDGRAATGVAKTYDPRFLSEIGARGIRANPAAAEAWYRKAIELGDQSAAGPVQLMDQGSGR